MSVVAVVLAALTMIMVHDQWEPAAVIRFAGVAAGAAFAVAAARWREEREQKLTAVTYGTSVRLTPAAVEVPDRRNSGALEVLSFT